MTDTFEIDMELLRRVGAAKDAVRALRADPGARAALVDAARAVSHHAGEAFPRVHRAFELVIELWTEADAEAGRLLPATSAFVEAVEEALVAESGERHAGLVGLAVSALRVAAGRTPEERGASEGLESLPCDPDEVSRLASLLIRIDEGDRGDLDDLLVRVREVFPDPAVAPVGVANAIDGLETGLEGSRWSDRRREAVRVALRELGTALEELDRRIEVARAGAIDGGAPPEVERPTLEEAPEARMAHAEADVVSPVDDEPASEEDSSDDLPVAEGPSGDESVEAVDGHSGTPVRVPESADPDLLEDFLAEGSDHLDQAESALLELESNPDDPEAVNVVFRAFHTIKGVAGFLELGLVAEVAHHAESLLSGVRDGKVLFSHPVADLTLRSADLLRDLLDGVRSAMAGDDAVVPAACDELIDILRDSARIERLAEGEALLLETAEEGKAAAGETSTGGAASAEADSSVRVKTARLDRLLDLVGELVVSHSMVAEDPALDHRSELMRKVVRSDKILRELQDLTTSMRMVPMKPAFRKVARVVRDVSRRAGKEIELITEGEETELDRSMVDLIADPLVHMVRNAIDHGIEGAEERRAAGKPPVGRLRISAGQLGGSVVIEIADDGRGLDRDRILAKARSRGIVESDRGLSDSDIHELIFAPGFSTAEAVTDISGRGVGMDVVRRSVESLRGRIDIESVPGRGSRFSIHLPLTLAITDGMLLRCGRERYIIPMVKIHSSVRPSPDDLYSVAAQGEMVQLHDQLLPVVRLAELYEVPGGETEPSRALLVVLGEGSRRFALMVDEILGQQQFVVKALTGEASETPGVAGGAILGDGEVGLILDPDELLTLARRGRAAVA